MDFSIMFWGDCDHGIDPKDKYRLLLDLAKRADEAGYAGLWVPERHFHPWGGLFPNPAVLASALAMVTKRIRLRAGSVVVPLHHPLRIAEEWSVVDNLSGGRVEVSVASGWKDDDFILAPDKYANRQTEMWKALDELLSIWRGNKLTGKNGSGRETEVAIYPRPIQPELPVWITSAGALRTITSAGGKGVNLLTHLLGQTYEDVGKRVQQYNAYRARGGFKEPGKVALMLHTFIGDDINRVKDIVREPFSDYLRQSADLFGTSARDLTPSELNEVVALAFDRYVDTASLIGTVKSCRAVIDRLSEIGVTEVCCLVDFGVQPDLVMQSLDKLNELKEACA